MKMLRDIVRYLDKTLDVGSFLGDSSNNGLQVENSGKVRKICCGVDASLEFFRAAKKKGADLLLCHHGMSWGDSLKRISGSNYRRVRFLIENDMALYACHLPLDSHARLGNNILLCRSLGLRAVTPVRNTGDRFAFYRGVLPKSLTRTEFKELVAARIGRVNAAVYEGPKRVRSVAVISGNGSGMMERIMDLDVDAYVSGEATLSAYNAAKDGNTNCYFAGHYRTEVFGVRALAGELKTRFRIPAEFVDLDIIH